MILLDIAGPIERRPGEGSEPQAATRSARRPSTATGLLYALPVVWGRTLLHAHRSLRPLCVRNRSPVGSAHARRMLGSPLNETRSRPSHRGRCVQRTSGRRFDAWDRVAPGRYSPRARTDPSFKGTCVRPRIQDAGVLLYCRRSLISMAGRGEHSHASKAAWWDSDLFCREVWELKGGRAVKRATDAAGHDHRGRLPGLFADTPAGQNRSSQRPSLPGWSFFRSGRFLGLKSDEPLC
jgi:hypothetical protein